MNQNINIIPYDHEAEQAIIGSIFYDNSITDDVLYKVNSKCFFSIYHQLIFISIEEIHKKGESIDEITIGALLKNKQKLEEAGGYSYIGGLVDCSPEVRNIDMYIDIVLEHFHKREFIKLNDESKKIEKKTASELINENIEKLNNLNDSMNVESNFEGIESIMKDVSKDFEKIIENKGELIGYKTGFIDLDKMILGLQKSELAILAARPSMGKTAKSLNIAYSIASNYPDETVLIFSLEMSKKQLVQRMQSFTSKIDLNILRQAKMESQDEWDNLMVNSDILTKLPILINDDNPITCERICSISKQYSKKNKISIIIIDYLGLIRLAKTVQSDEVKISEITSMLKGLAKQLDCNILLLSQLNRALEQRSNKRPIMSDLKGSGAIEADADLIMFIYRDEVYNESSSDKGIAEILVSKNRSGSTGKIKLQFNGKYTKFSNLSKHDY